MPAEHVPHIRVELAICRPSAEQYKSRLLASAVDHTDQHPAHADPLLRFLHLRPSPTKVQFPLAFAPAPVSPPGRVRASVRDTASGRPSLPAARLSGQRP